MTPSEFYELYNNLGADVALYKDVDNECYRKYYLAEGDDGSITLYTYLGHSIATLGKLINCELMYGNVVRLETDTCDPTDYEFLAVKPVKIDC